MQQATPATSTQGVWPITTARITPTLRDSLLLLHVSRLRYATANYFSLLTRTRHCNLLLLTSHAYTYCSRVADAQFSSVEEAVQALRAFEAEADELGLPLTGTGLTQHVTCHKPPLPITHYSNAARPAPHAEPHYQLFTTHNPLPNSQ